MYRCLFGVLLIFLCAAGLAQKPQLPASDGLAAIATRGKLLYEYDQAAWHSTDAVQNVDTTKGVIDRYVAQKTESGWIVMWGRFTQSRDKFLIAYEAIQSESPGVFTVKKHEPPLEDTGFYFHAAVAIATARQEFHGEQRPYNMAVLPADKAFKLTSSVSQNQVHAPARHRNGANGSATIVGKKSPFHSLTVKGDLLSSDASLLTIRSSLESFDLCMEIDSHALGDRPKRSQNLRAALGVRHPVIKY
jgi:hypothetical protein